MIAHADILYRRPVMWAGLAALVIVIFCITPITTENHGLDSDGGNYVAVSLEGLSRHSEYFYAPFCWRTLGPWIAGLLPFQIITSFRLVAMVANVISAILILEFLLAEGVSRNSANSSPSLYFPLGRLISWPKTT